jgi:sugar lactone lactonase YvrE
MVTCALGLLLGSAPAAGAACRQWSPRTLLSGQGWLENLAFDRRGGLFVSALARGAILRVEPSGRARVLLDSVNAPGGLRVRDGFLYFNTGNRAASGLMGLADGTIGRYRFETRRRTTWASGLTMPNGLIFLPNGDAVVSRDLGTGTGMTRIRRRDRRHPQVNWSPHEDSNGMAVDPSGKWLYTDETGSPDSRVVRIRIAHPARIRTVARLGSSKGLDDMTIDGKGRLFIAAFVAGEVIRLNPATGASCVIASGLVQPTSVRFGAGRGWSRRSLYVTAADGTLRKLSPP